MKPSKVGMHNFLERPSLIKTANGDTVDSEGHGSIGVVLWYFGAPKKRTMTEVLYSSALSFDLFSLREATDLRHTEEGKSEGVMLYL